MDTIYVIGIVAICVLAVYLGVKHYNEKVKLDGDAIEQGTDKIINVVETILDVIDFDDKTEKTIQDVLYIADDVSHYIADVLDESEDKVSASLLAIKKILAALNVKVTESEQKLISIVVTESIQFVDKKK